MTEFTYATGETGIVVNRLVTELTLRGTIPPIERPTVP